MNQLTDTEFEAARDGILRCFADCAEKDKNQVIWALSQGPSVYTRDLLWLFTFALSFYSHDPAEYNYITEEDVMFFFAHVNSMP